MPRSAHSWSNACWPLAARPRRPNRRSVNSRSEPLKAPLVQAQWRAPAGHRSTPTASFAAPSHRPLAPGSTWSAAGGAWDCGHARYPGASICRWSARSCPTVPPEPRRSRHSPGWRPAPWASLSPSPSPVGFGPMAPPLATPRTKDGQWLDCEDGSAWQHPVPNVPQNRSCPEKSRSPRVYVIIRDGTVIDPPNHPRKPGARGPSDQSASGRLIGLIARERQRKGKQALPNLTLVKSGKKKKGHSGRCEGGG